MNCTSYIYPSDIYKIEGLEGYEDLERLYQFTEEKMSSYGDSYIEVYLNGGLLIEILAVLVVSQKLDINIHLFHWNRKEGFFLEQPIEYRRTNIVKDAPTSIVEMGLCANRHSFDELKYIYEAIEENYIFDFRWLEEQAEKKIRTITGNKLRLYATGLTTALLSVVNVCIRNHICIEVMHFNMESERYFSQEI